MFVSLMKIIFNIHDVKSTLLFFKVFETIQKRENYAYMFVSINRIRKTVEIVILHATL